MSGTNFSESKFLKTFSSSTTQRRNGQPLSKRPKLDIDKHISLSGTLSNQNCRPIKEDKDLYDDIWGDDLDSTALEKVEFEETLALSQMPDTFVGTNLQGSTHMSVAQSSRSKPAQGAQSYFSTKSSNTSEVDRPNNRAVPTSFMDIKVARKNTPRVPLRRTASSGWPSANQPQFQLNNMPVAKNKIFGTSKLQGPNDVINTVQSDLERLRIENEQLREKLSRKIGETNLIRSRLISVEQECSKQKKDYLDKLHSVQHEAEEITTCLSKEIESLKGQLDVKDMEIETSERRVMHLNTVRRLQPDSPSTSTCKNVRNVFSPGSSNKQAQQEDRLMFGRNHLKDKKFPYLLELMKEQIVPELLKPTQPEASIIENVRTISNPGLFSGSLRSLDMPSTSSGHSSKSMFHTQNSAKEVLPAAQRQLSVPCPPIEPCSLYLLSPKLLDISSDNAHQTILQVLETCLKILKSLLSQLETSVCPQKRYLEREREILYCGHKYMKLTGGYNLLCSKELYNNERGICARRALALIALLVECSNFAAEQILPSSTVNQTEQENTDKITDEPTDNVSGTTPDPHTLLKIIMDIVCLIEKQRVTLMFEGVLAGVTSLIRNLLQTEVALNKDSQEIIVQILKRVVFTRPGSLVILYILQILLAATKYPEIIDTICHNSVTKSFAENTRHSIATFSADTCILQVLCTLLKVVETPKKHIMTDVFTSWVMTLFYSMQRNPRWLFSVPSQTSCQCRPLISRLAFTLLGEACCMYPTVSETNSEKKLLEKLLRRGVLLVCTLLYHDEHFGVNVDPDSVGYYELFLHSMTLIDIDVKLNKACRETLETLCVQESLRQPTVVYSGTKSERDNFLKSLYSSGDSCDNILERLDTL